ncbi:MAG: thiamine biosynthesis protein ThiS [Candidatus Meridianibacter frigidus]|nr:MAG: thiamine biosynthesis protein ThiS [Candidatus Eremiobacteraeota bacterium]
MRAFINGQEREFRALVTLEELLESVNAPRTGIAVARNQRVVKRADFGTELVQDGDRIEIINAVAGG